MSRVSVVTVTFENAKGLEATLASLAALRAPPGEVLVIDGGSRDGTRAVIAAYAERLPLTFVSERDDGIYDAMNKGQRLASGELVHYLNAGDRVFGEPYEGVAGPCRLPVRVVDEGGALLFEDFLKHGGWGYCHQGLIVPRAHPPYRTALRIAADFDMIIATFPRGLRPLPLSSSGGVVYGLGGVSSQKARERDRELAQVARERLPPVQAWAIIALIAAKNAVPRQARRIVAKAVDALRTRLAGRA